MRHLGIRRGSDSGTARRGWGEPPSPPHSVPCTEVESGAAPSGPLRAQESGGPMQQRREVTTCDCQQQTREEGGGAGGEAGGRSQHFWVSGYQNSSSLKKNRFIENSGGRPRSLPTLPHRWCFQAREGTDLWSRFPGTGPGPDSLVLDSRRGEGLQGCSRGSQCPQLGWGKGSRSRQSRGKAGRCRGRERCGVICPPTQEAEKRPIRQAWPRPHPLCHPPPRPSIHQRLSGPSGGVRQMACPRASACSSGS